MAILLFVNSQQFLIAEQVLYYENFDLQNVVTPVDVDRYEQLLLILGYDKNKSKELVTSFREGFSLGYQGNMNIK